LQFIQFRVGAFKNGRFFLYCGIGFIELILDALHHCLFFSYGIPNLEPVIFSLFDLFDSHVKMVSQSDSFALDIFTNDHKIVEVHLIWALSLIYFFDLLNQSLVVLTLQFQLLYFLIKAEDLLGYIDKRGTRNVDPTKMQLSNNVSFCLEESSKVTRKRGSLEDEMSKRHELFHH